MPEADVRTLLLDIEGTTTPIDFVYQVLFPYARRHVTEFVQLHANDLQEDISALKTEHRADSETGNSPPEWRDSSPDLLVESTAQYVYWLMDADRKSTALKSLQGKIWEAGYMNGSLRAEVYPDVPPAFARWTRQQKQIYIYSSGSVLAQKLLFAHTTAGDLTRYISDYFDTTTGTKKIAASYRTIADNLRASESEILFISDVSAELDAAQEAGMRTMLCVRPQNAPTKSSSHPLIEAFDVVFP